MRISGITLGRATTDDLDQVLLRSRSADVTYDWVGATLEPGHRGRRPFTRHVDVATDGGGFERAIDALRTWVAHRGIKARIHPPDAPVQVGETLLVVAPFGPFEMVAPDRIVAAVEEPDRFGWAYGTLPGHPERGEESFVAERLDDRAVRITIRVDAVPGTPLMQVGAPFVRRFQRAALARYLDAVATHVRSA